MCRLVVLLNQGESSLGRGERIDDRFAEIQDSLRMHSSIWAALPRLRTKRLKNQLCELSDPEQSITSEGIDASRTSIDRSAGGRYRQHGDGRGSALSGTALARLVKKHLNTDSSLDDHQRRAGGTCYRES